MKRKLVTTIFCIFLILINSAGVYSWQMKGRDEDFPDKDRSFDFVYPITYIMPDDTTITVEYKEDWEDIKTWYETNPNVKEKPKLQYPVEIILNNGTIQTVNNEEEMKRAYVRFYGYRCFEFVYPITYIMPDDTTITVEHEDDYDEIKGWYEKNPDYKERPRLQYPVEIIWKDGTIQIIYNEEELKAAYKECWWGDNDGKDDDDDDNGGDSDSRIRYRIRERIRWFLERLRARIRERLSRG
jgi:hypothetical protein